MVWSMTVHGDRDDATAALARWAATAHTVRAGRRAAPGIAVGDLLMRWLTAPHGWRPSTCFGYSSNVKALRADPLGARRAATVTPHVLRAAMACWADAGVGGPTVAGRVRCLRSAFTWAYRKNILDIPPLRGMRGPAAGPTRLHARLVDADLAHAGAQRYRAAARRLDRMRALAAGTPRAAEVDAHIADLRQEHRRGPRVQQEFARAGLP